MNPQDAADMAQMLTECYASALGCKRLPVRMILERPADLPDVIDADVVMLCVDHSATCVPTGTVIDDRMLVSDDNLTLFVRRGL